MTTSSDDLTATIKALGSKITGYASRPARINEADTIRAFVTPMIRALGWDVEDIDEVRSEYRHGTGDNPVDYALLIEGEPVLFVEAKSLFERLDDRRWIIQTLNYANAANVAWAVLTNGVEWRVYNVHTRAEAEDKLFYATRLDGADAATTSRRLSMLAKARMVPERALDQLWHDARVDLEMRQVIADLPKNREAVRAMARRSEGLSEEDVRDALVRLQLRADWCDHRDLFPTLNRDAAAGLRTNGDVDDRPAPPLEAEASEQLAPAAANKTENFKMADLVAAGKLIPGERLRLRGQDNSEAVVVDGRHCEFGGRRMSYNAWGKAATGWKSIQIYVRAETSKGVLLQDLRRQLAAERAADD